MATDKDILKPWETMESHTLLAVEPWMKISKERVKLPDGTIVDDYYRIEMPEYVVVVAYTLDGRIVLERQYKHGVGHSTTTLPSGGIETGESPLVAAQRELLEETGYASEDWRSLGSFVVNGNRGCGTAHMLLAREARQVAEPASGDLEEMIILLAAPDQIADMLRNGELETLGTVAALAIATNPLFAPQM